MAIAAVLLDQRESSRSRDLVRPWLAAARDPSLRFLRPFERTAGDEMEALVADPATLTEVIRRALEDRHWWVGIGIGEIEEPVPQSVRESHGSAFSLARAAIERSKSPRGAGVRVLALDEPLGRVFEDALVVLADLYDRRPPRAREVARLRRDGLETAAIAARLGISRQAVTKHLRAARWREEAAAVRVAGHLAEELLV